MADTQVAADTLFGHNYVASILMSALTAHVAARQLGMIFVEAPFVLTFERQWVKGSRVPDIMFVAAQRLAEYRANDPQASDKPLVLVPDLVVKIISPNDKYSEVDEKVETYLQDGVRLVWVIDLQRRKVAVHAPNTPQVWLAGDSQLTGGDVIPGFEITVASLFE